MFNYKILHAFLVLLILATCSTLLSLFEFTTLTLTCVKHESYHCEIFCISYIFVSLCSKIGTEFWSEILKGIEPLELRVDMHIAFNMCKLFSGAQRKKNKAHFQNPPPPRVLRCNTVDLYFTLKQTGFFFNLTLTLRIWCIDGHNNTVLKWVSDKYSMRMFTGFIWLRIGISGGNE
jgi:hypothetical protein